MEQTPARHAKVNVLTVREWREFTLPSKALIPTIRNIHPRECQTAEHIDILLEEIDTQEQKATGLRLMLGQIGGIVERTPEINYSNYGIEEVQAQNEAIIEISQLLGTFEERPEEVAPKCKECGYEAENKDLQLQVRDLAMLVRLLCREVQKGSVNNRQVEKAQDYLRRKGLQGSPLREGEATNGE